MSPTAASGVARRTGYPPFQNSKERYAGVKICHCWLLTWSLHTIIGKVPNVSPFDNAASH